LKKLLSVLLCIIVLMTVFPLTSFADSGGSGNIDDGGGGIGNGSSGSFWHPGMDGVRVTVVNATTEKIATTPIDFTNKKPTVNVHFGKVSKIQYRNGASLTPSTASYTYYNPSVAMPTIISSESQSASIDKIKAYFCDQIIIRYIAQITGISYSSLISGKYKLLLEPVAYFTFLGTQVAMTADEAALYDNLISGGLRSKMAALSHKNLPLAMFLQYADLGFTAYTGPTDKTCSNNDIIANLGLGIVRFTDDLPVVTPTNNEYEYRVNTDVITPVTLYTTNEISPDNPAKVTFKIGGSSYTVSNIVIPENESQLVWVKWRTPSSPQAITITVSSTQGVLNQTSIKSTIVTLAGHDPPDPKATDTKGSWSAVSIPNRIVKTSASWSVWSAAWQTNWIWQSDWVWQSNIVWVSNWVWVPNVQWVSDWKYESYSVWQSNWGYVGYQVWVPDIISIPFIGNIDFGHYETQYKWVDNGKYVTKWHWTDHGSYKDLGKYVDKGSYADKGKWVDNGKWMDEGWYDFTRQNYSASLSASMSLYPDDKVPTAYAWTMKSGYGVKNTATATVTTSAPDSQFTYAQTAVSYFPEFKYQTYWRLLDCVTSGRNAVFQFASNPYSTYNRRVQFTPLWFPDGYYTANTYIMDIWTPAGMLCTNTSNYVNILGSLYNDWHIAPTN
jgi:hypothetical protein